MRTSTRVQARNVSVEAEATRPDSDPSLPPPPPPADTEHLSSLLSMNVSPFLFKTYSLVNDPSTDSIVSWSADGTTFTVHKPDAMEREVLPHVFKHSNFASFVRQLNNYGFRKCHTDRYEFGVSGFQRGNPELLKTLKRHDSQRSSRKSGGTRARRGGSVERGASADRDSPRGTALLELGAYGGLQTEVEQLKRDRRVLLDQVLWLRQKGERTAEEVSSLNARLAATEAVQQQMLSFLQLHLSPSLVAASSHLLPGRKRRHLLLPPSPGREEAMEGAGRPLGEADSLDLGLEFMEGLSMPGALGGPSAAGGFSLHELPDADAAPAVAQPPPPRPMYDAQPSYDAAVPSPRLPPVMAMPGSDGFEWSDMLEEGLGASPPPSPTGAGPLARMASEDIHVIMREIGGALPDLAGAS